MAQLRSGCAPTTPTRISAICNTLHSQEQRFATLTEVDNSRPLRGGATLQEWTLTYRQARVAGLTLRADARSNKARVLDGARRAFADLGFDASYHDIARIANVGVGTVYRRYPEREVLLEEVLLDLLQDLTKQSRTGYGRRRPLEILCEIL